MTSGLTFGQCTGCDYFNSIPGGSLVVANGEVACFSGTASYTGSISVNNGGTLQICGVDAELSLSNGVSLFPGARMEIYDCAKLIQFGSFADFGVAATYAFCSDCGEPSYTSDTAVQTVGSRWFTGWTCDATLPVELIEFYVAVQNSEVALHWSTASEINNSRFEIEYSNDGVIWSTIGVVAGSGNSSTQQDYSFIDFDNNGLSGYYRLKQVDFDGKYEYTETVWIENEGQGMSLSRNSNGNYNVNINIPGEVDVKVYNLSGQLITYRSYVNSTTEGKFIVELDANAFADGMYLVQVENGTDSFSEKFIIQK
jgi:hypothetical protein